MEEKVEVGVVQLPWLKLFQAIVDLARRVFPLPLDWKSEEQVKLWLAGCAEPLAKLIVLITSAETEKASAEKPNGDVAARVFAVIQGEYVEALKQAGGVPEAIDWSNLIDWIVVALSAMFPAYAAVIKLIGEILKQLLAMRT